MAVVDALIIGVISLIVGVVAIHLGARLVIDSDVGFRRAAIAALVGAVVYAVFGFVAIIPILGPLLLLLVWIAIINWQYPGGWGTAIAIGLIAWVIAVVILYVLGTLGVVGLDALGVPGA